MKNRILMIGNIANNAYLNAKILRDAGYSVDVLCNDYYHIMGCPEWEEAQINLAELDPFEPQWYRVNLHDYIRPKWFVQGPMTLCLKYLYAKNKYGENSLVSKILIYILNKFNSTDKKGVFFVLSIELQKKMKLFIQKVINSIILIRKSLLKRGIIGTCNKIVEICINLRNNNITNSLKAENLLIMEENLFKKYVGVNEIRLQKVFSSYDIIIGYAISGVYPLALGYKYIAFEHGTIRSIPFQQDELGIVCNEVYTKAAHVFITNCDNIIAAKKLGLKNYSFIPHPISDVRPSGKFKRTDFGVGLEEFLIVHPSRQHWDKNYRDPSLEKGNDIFIEGLAKFIRSSHKAIKCIMVDWGAKLAKSKNLIEDLGIAENIIWIAPVSHNDLVDLMAIADCVADQFFLGTFGAIPPKCFKLGTPVLMYLNPEHHSWCFNELPPLLNASTSEKVCQELTKLSLYDQNILKEFKEQSRLWFENNYSNETIVKTFESVFSQL